MTDAGRIFVYDATGTGAQPLQFGSAAPSTGERFGYSVALDGTTALAGAPGNDDAGLDAGAAYLIDIVSGTELFQLTASNATTLDAFGSSVALSGNLAVVGAPGVGTGTAYVFDVTTGAELFELTASGLGVSDGFGTSVAIDGTLAVVGAPFHRVSGEQSGAAWVFDASTGTELFKLATTSVGDEAEFGHAVAIQGDHVVVGSPAGNGTTSWSGAVWVFSSTTGSEEFQLEHDAMLDNGDRFGASVAIHGDSILVGAPGDATAGFNAGAAFRFDLATGMPVEDYLPDEDQGQECGTSVALLDVVAIVGAPKWDDSTLVTDSGQAVLYEVSGASSGALSYSEDSSILPSSVSLSGAFGVTIDLDGTTALIGEPYARVGNKFSAGAAYVVDVQTGTQLIRLTAGSPANSDRFGSTVSLDGNLALVGAPGDTISGAVLAGSAELLDVTSGASLFKLKASSPALNDRFGDSVALEGSIALVGASADDHSGKTDAGSAFVFDTATGAQIHHLKANGPKLASRFGFSVALSGMIALAGAPYEDHSGLNNAGSVYVFDLTTGAQLSKWIASDASDFHEFGASIDTDAGIVVIGAPSAPGQPLVGKAYVFDLATGTELFTLQAWDAQLGDRFGRTVRISGDTIAVGAVDHDGAHAGSGAVYTFDARTGSQLAKYEASAPELWAQVGTGLAIDGEILLAGNERGPSSPGALLMDARTLVEDLATLSLSTGGTQAFELRSGPSNAGGMFLFLGSATGTSPGFPDAFNGWNIPLNLDAYTMILMNRRGAGLFSPWAGALDADGVGQSAFGFPGGQDPSLVGTVLHHAFLTTHPSKSGFTHISNAVALELVP